MEGISNVSVETGKEGKGLEYHFEDHVDDDTPHDPLSVGVQPLEDIRLPDGGECMRQVVVLVHARIVVLLGGLILLENAASDWRGE